MNITEHLECAYKIMKGYDLSDEGNYWDAMSHIHDAYKILKNDSARFADWKDWCTCDRRQKDLEESNKQLEKELLRQGYKKVEHDGIVSYEKKLLNNKLIKVALRSYKFKLED